MEEVHDVQESETASIVKVAREPAIIINGVPDLAPDCSSGSQSEVRDAAESQVDPRFGEWLEGRKVRKPFGDKYYVGKVVTYDSESNWYNVVYEDGDQEDLEWHELEEVLLPLDITIPLKTLVMDKCKLQNTVPDHRPKVAKQRKDYATMVGNVNKTSDMVPIPQGSDVMSNQTATGAVNGQQSNNVSGLILASASNDATSFGLQMLTAGEIAQVIQPRKRGRPRKDRTISSDNQPKKRGRPPKNRSTSGNSQSAEIAPSSLALVPVQDASAATDMQEASRRQDSVHKRNTLTAKAEKLKRENLRVQGAPPGTQLF